MSTYQFEYLYKKFRSAMQVTGELVPTRPQFKTLLPFLIAPEDMITDIRETAETTILAYKMIIFRMEQEQLDQREQQDVE